MNIGFISIFILVILLCIPVYLIYFFKLNLQHKVALAIGKAVGFLALTGIIYKLELSWNSITFNLLLVVLLALLTAFVTISKARFNMKKYFVPAFLSTLIVTFCLGIFVLLLIGSLVDALEIGYLLPVAGFMAGSIIESNYKALDAYYAGLKHHRALYYYLLGTGASHIKP